MLGRPRRFLLALGLGVGLGAGGLPLACASDRVPTPFGPGAGGSDGEGGDGTGGFMLDVDAGDAGPDPTLGGPCEDDGQCDDRVDCTNDSCDQELGRCRFRPDDDVCDDAVFCDGAERCDVREGCVEGEPVACSDDNTCTIDRCDEDTKSCRNEPRDADGDGEATRSCSGLDCDDTDPFVNSAATEVCGNGRDDDCDGAKDEDDCATPEYDTCDAPLEIAAAGSYDLDLTATRLDYPNGCATSLDGYRDAVLNLLVPEGGPFDVDVIAKRDEGKLALASEANCGAGEVASCEESFATPSGARSARLILRAVEAGQYPLYVASDSEGPVQIRVDFRPAESFPGELCEDAPALEPNGPEQLVRLPAYAADADSACEPETGDAFFSFTLEEARDVSVIAEAQLDLGLPVLSLLDGACQHELTCRSSQPGRLFVRALAAGTHRVALAGTGPDDVSVRVETTAVSEAPPGAGCSSAQPLEPGVEQLVDLSSYEDSVDTACLVGAPDVTFGFTLEGKRDVALIGRFSEGDEGAVSLTSTSCQKAQACRSGLGTQRAVKYGLAAGDYRAIVESAQGNPIGLTRFERPALPAVVVPFADDCDGLVTIPEAGGRFSGNTTNAFPDFDAGCDVGGQAEGGAPDQMLKLRLSAPRRVVLDMQGSSFNTMLSVREGEFCPGVERPASCAPGYLAGRSYLDLDLQAGDYFIQIDGYDGASGAWKLDVFTAPL